jgi:GH24 family phage-related lysozyme (muramidase)
MINQSLLLFIISLEGFSSCAYWDVSQWSNGYGTKANNKWECIGKTEAKSRMVKHLELDSKHVLSLFPTAKQNEHDALVSYCYNSGRYGCTKAVKLAASGNKNGASWVMRQKVNKGLASHSGLKNRRIAEVALLNKEDKKKNFTCIYQEYS